MACTSSVSLFPYLPELCRFASCFRYNLLTPIVSTLTRDEELLPPKVKRTLCFEIFFKITADEIYDIFEKFGPVTD